MNIKISQGIMVSAVIVMMMIVEGLALKCYECNSENDKDCVDPKAAANPEKFEVTCATGQSYCRKIEQDMNIDGDDIKRYHRQCATRLSGTANGECLERTGTYRFKTWYCECTGDLCNSSTTNSVSLVLSVLASSIFVLRNLL